MVALGLDYPTQWGRSYRVRSVRWLAQRFVITPLVRRMTSLTVHGTENFAGPGPFIITPNHNSHLDTPVTLSALPPQHRAKTVVAAAMDNFFMKRSIAFLTVLFFNGIPVDRHKVNRRSAELAQEVLEDGWNLIIYPEGGRTTTGDLMDFKPGAAYLAEKSGAAVIPTYVHDAGFWMGWRFAKADVHREAPHQWRRPLSVHFGTPLRMTEGESMRTFNERIHDAVADLGRRVSGNPRYGASGSPS